LGKSWEAQDKENTGFLWLIKSKEGTEGRKYDFHLKYHALIEYLLYQSPLLTLIFPYFTMAFVLLHDADHLKDIQLKLKRCVPLLSITLSFLPKEHG
jgi:hypothetical protein